jgi:colanic acid biosynthesis glycosyl transferase WcaI
MPGQVVFVNRFFHPDQSATSQMLADLAFGLAKQGLQVVVVASRQTYEDPRAALPKSEIVSGVRIERVRSTAFGRTRNLGRLFDYLTFHWFATLAAARLLRAGDVLVAKTDPPLISVPLSLVSRWRRVALVNWLQDLFPEVLAVAMGRSRLTGWLGWLKNLRNRSLCTARVNVVLGARMARRVAAEGVPVETIQIIENWSDGERVRPVPREANALRAQWEMGERFVVGYSGNLGVAHEFGAIIEAAVLLREHAGIAFLFIGAGAQLSRVKQAAEERGLSNVHFRPYQPQDRLAESLSVPDVHLVCLRPEMEGLIVPSKVYGVLAAGRPCIFIGDPQGEVAATLREIGCGTTVGAGAPAELATAIASLASSPRETAEMGRIARQAFEARFQARNAVDKWVWILSSLGVQRPAC